MWRSAMNAANVIMAKAYLAIKAKYHGNQPAGEINMKISAKTIITMWRNNIGERKKIMEVESRK
jgi:hypothetical protein